MRRALNHMTVPGLDYAAFLDLAQSLDCEGVEVRNDIARPLFDGLAPVAAGELARERGLRLVGLSQVYPFNDWSTTTAQAVRELLAIGAAAGAETISLIPRNDGVGLANGERQAQLKLALGEIKPMLADTGIVALVEPLGFQRSSLRHKQELVDVIEALDARAEFRLVHDTFHHALAGGGAFFPEYTGIVHISGVVDPGLSLEQMEDEHRVLVDSDDRLGNVAQIAELQAAGYDGVISYECFAPSVHALADPRDALARSFEFIDAELQVTAV